MFLLASELFSLTNPWINLIGNAHCAIIPINSSFSMRVKCSRAISVVPENEARNAERSPCGPYARWRRLAQNCGSVLLRKWVWSRPREKGCSLISPSSRAVSARVKMIRNARKMARDYEPATIENAGYEHGTSVPAARHKLAQQPDVMQK